MELRSGIRVDRYVLLDRLGNGAQGSVWSVRDPLDGVDKALKLFDLTSLSARGAERARREAQAVTKLKHPAIVACHALFELPAEGRLGLVFDLVRGRSLADAASDARMTALHRDALLVQVAAALEHVHVRGIVHRDLKPSNILVADTFWEAPNALGGMKVVDFGIAADVGNPRGITATGGFVGTRPYLAPDLLLPGRWGSSSDGFTRDIFAFGVLAWELLAGGHPTGVPFDAAVEKFAAAYREAADGRRPWPPPGLSSSRAWLISACLALDPAHRPTDGAALVAALQPGTVAAVPPAPAAGAVPATPTEDKDVRTDAGAGGHAFARAPAVPTLEAARREMPASTVPMTAPMPGPPPISGSSLVTPMPVVDTASVRSAGIRPVSRREPQRRRSAAQWILAGLAAAVPLAGVAIYIMVTSTVSAIAPAPVPQPRPQVTVPIRNTDVPAPVPCCVDAAACLSGRPCATEPCTPTNLPERWWYLRVTGVGMRSAEQIRTGPPDSFPEDLSKTHPHGRVCLRRVASPDSTVCVPIKKAALTQDGDRENRLRVRTSDLKSGGIEIWVEDAGMELTRGSSAPNSRGISTSVLCRGMSLYAGTRGDALARVYAFLDDG